MTDEEIDAVFAQSEQERETKAEIAMERWGLGQGGGWTTDLANGVIRFDTPKGKFVAAAQFIGTLNTEDGSWIWGWDHPMAVPEHALKNAALVRAFGERSGLELLTERRVQADESDGWAFADLACHLGDAQGVYRVPSGKVVMFLTFSDVAPD